MYLLLLLLLGLTALALVLVAARARASLGAVPRVPPAGPPSPAPRVSVLVPARNEAGNIEACLRSLLAQDYPDFELIVLDDQSSDGTDLLVARMASLDRRLQLVRGQELPPGWTGKSFALAQAASLAHSDWLVFTDADTQHHPSALSSALRSAQLWNADLLSLATGQILGGFWERVVQPVVLSLIGLAAPIRAINDPTHRETAFANGQFILARRTAYAAIGGHAAVRGEIVEDCELAKRAKKAGHRVLLADGRSLVTTRMYRGFRDLWQGWSKNMFLGPGARLSVALAGLVVITLVGVGPFAVWGLAALSALVEPERRTLALLAVSTLQLGVVLYGWAKVCRSFGLGWRYAVALPLGALVLNAILVNSAYSHLAGRGVVWKGRRYTQGAGASGRDSSIRKPGSR